MDAKNIPVAAQLYIFSNLPDRDAKMPQILRELADAGYDAVEGMYGQEPKTPQMVADVGLRYLTPHLALAQMIGPTARDEVIAFTRRMNAPSICLSGLPVWDQRFAPDYRGAVTLLNQYAAAFAPQMTTILYHNHDFEFLPLGGDDGATTGMDILLDGLDRSISLCVDIGWIWRTGTDPARFLHSFRDGVDTPDLSDLANLSKSLSRRARNVSLLHLRDFRGEMSVPLGQGDVPLKAILAEIPALQNLKALVIEQDPTSDDPIADMQASIEWLRANL